MLFLLFVSSCRCPYDASGRESGFMVFSRRTAVETAGFRMQRRQEQRPPQPDCDESPQTETRACRTLTGCSPRSRVAGAAALPPPLPVWAAASNWVDAASPGKIIWGLWALFGRV